MDIRYDVRNLDAIISSGEKKIALIDNLHYYENLPGVKLLFSSIVIETLKNKNEGENKIVENNVCVPIHDGLNKGHHGFYKESYIVVKFILVSSFHCAVSGCFLWRVFYRY